MKNNFQTLARWFLVAGSVAGFGCVSAPDRSTSDLVHPRTLPVINGPLEDETGLTGRWGLRLPEDRTPTHRLRVRDQWLATELHGSEGDRDEDSFGGLSESPSFLDADHSASFLLRPRLRTQTEELSLKEMAQKSNNPLSDVWLGLVQNDYVFLKGDSVVGTKALNSLKIQPVMPVPVFDQKWNLIFRPVINVVSSPLGLNGEPDGRTAGFGDTVLFALLGPNRDDGFVWGLGPTFIFPTAEHDIIGQEKWQVGPAALAVRLGKESGGLGIESWNIGVLPQHWWSFDGASDRPHTSQTDIQYFVNWKMNDTQLIGMTPNIRIDWTKPNSGDRLSFPIGIGTIGMFKLGRVPVRWGIEVQYYVIQPDDIASEWDLKIFFAPIILNPLK